MYFKLPDEKEYNCHAGLNAGILFFPVLQVEKIMKGSHLHRYFNYTTVFAFGYVDRDSFSSKICNSLNFMAHQRDHIHIHGAYLKQSSKHRVKKTPNSLNKTPKNVSIGSFGFKRDGYLFLIGKIIKQNKFRANHMH